MTINRQWIAREWLYLLAGLVWAFILSPILMAMLAPRLRFFIPFWFFVLSFGPYPIFQLWRITAWAIRTVRETDGGK